MRISSLWNNKLVHTSLSVFLTIIFIPQTQISSGKSLNENIIIQGAVEFHTAAPRSVGIPTTTRKPESAITPSGITKEVPKKITHQVVEVAAPPPKEDPLLRIQEQAALISPEQTFAELKIDIAGQYDNAVNPPDTVGDVGVNYYIQAINTINGTSISIYNKSDGSVISGPFLLESLGSGACANGLGDPIVLYDSEARRWLLNEFSNIGNNLCVYISQTSDPTGSWWAYTFSTPNFPDYPKYGVWGDAYYVSTNESSPTVYALQRSEMLDGNAASIQRMTLPSLAGFSFQAVIPADLDGSNGPPAHSPGYFMRHRDDEAHNPGSNNPSEDYLEVWEMQVDWNTPANTTLTQTAEIAVAEFDSDLCGLTSFNCFDQPGTGTLLDPLREIIMNRLQYRNFLTYQTLVGNFVTDVSGTDHAGIRWFELRKTGSGSWSLNQEGTYSPDTADRWIGSIAMDGCGNIALGYNVVDGGASVYPGMRYVGRLAQDTPGTMPQGEYSIVEGGDYNSSNRYGDYSAMSVDPEDDSTFWYTAQYNPAGTANKWRTRIASFQFEKCKRMNILHMLPKIRPN